MRFTNPAFILCLLSCTCCFAQTDSTSQSKRHELGLHVGPMATFLLGGHSGSQPFGATWKQVSGRSATRISYRYGYRPVTLDVTQRYEIDDMLVSKSHERRQNNHVLSLGREFRYPLRHGMQLLFGLDAQVRWLSQGFRVLQTVSTIDTVLNKGTVNEFYVTENPRGSTLYKSKTSGLQYGIAVSTGLLVPIRSHWWLSGQLRLDSFYGTLKEKSHDLVTQQKSNKTTSNLELNINSLLSELAVFYRF